MPLRFAPISRGVDAAPAELMPGNMTRQSLGESHRADGGHGNPRFPQIATHDALQPRFAISYDDEPAAPSLNRGHQVWKPAAHAGTGSRAGEGAEGAGTRSGTGDSTGSTVHTLRIVPMSIWSSWNVGERQ